MSLYVGSESKHQRRVGVTSNAQKNKGLGFRVYGLGFRV